MQKLTEEVHKKISKLELFMRGLYSGVGWAFGVTIGFVIVSTIVVFVLQSLGGLPIIGSWVADIVEETQVQLLRRTPVF